MDQEKLKILKMVEEKKITADDAAKLLDALDGAEPTAESARASSDRSAAVRFKRSLRLKVSDLESGRVRVNLCIPVGIAHVIKSLIPPQEMQRLEQRGINLSAIMEAISSDTVGKVFDVEDEEHHAHVEISIE